MKSRGINLPRKFGRISYNSAYILILNEMSPFKITKISYVNHIIIIVKNVEACAEVNCCARHNVNVTGVLKDR